MASKTTWAIHYRQRNPRGFINRYCAFAMALLWLSTATNLSQAHEAHWQVVQPRANSPTQHTDFYHRAAELRRTPSQLLPSARNARLTSHSRWNESLPVSGAVNEQGWYRTTPAQRRSHVTTASADDSRAVAPVVGRRSGTLPPSPNSPLATAIDNTHAAESIEFNDARFSPVEQEVVRSSTPSSTINLDMFVGEVKVLGPVDTTRVAVGNGGIVDAKVIESKELLIIATSVGSTSLRLWNTDSTQTDYNIRVAETDPQTRLRMEPMVRMRVRMVEFRKSALGRLGIDWSDSAAGPTLAASGASASNRLFSPTVEGVSSLPTAAAPFSTYFGITSNIASRINFLAQNGDAVTLAEPVLSAMNGGEASFLAGGEVPYPSVGQNGQTQVEFKDYGVKLNVAPLIDNAGNVRAKLETEISQLDSSVSVQGAPGLLTRRAQTEVTVRSGETIVISGLLSSESSGDVDMIPGIGRLPIIGRFFSSDSKRNSVSELVIFVTPEVIQPQQAMISEREQRYYQESSRRITEVRKRLPLME